MQMIMLYRPVEVLKLINNSLLGCKCIFTEDSSELLGKHIKVGEEGGGLICLKTPVILKCLRKSLKD